MAKTKDEKSNTPIIFAKDEAHATELRGRWGKKKYTIIIDPTKFGGVEKKATKTYYVKTLVIKRTTVATLYTSDGVVVTSLGKELRVDGDFSNLVASLVAKTKIPTYLVQH
jgi:hypothetical protein